MLIAATPLPTVPVMREKALRTPVVVCDSRDREPFITPRPNAIGDWTAPRVGS